MQKGPQPLAAQSNGNSGTGSANAHPSICPFMCPTATSSTCSLRRKPSPHHRPSVGAPNHLPSPPRPPVPTPNRQSPARPARDYPAAPSRRAFRLLRVCGLSHNPEAAADCLCPSSHTWRARYASETLKSNCCFTLEAVFGVA
jgi:hypothetical protein